jgi:threonine synthase
VTARSATIGHVLGLTCLICGRRFDPGDVTYVCPDHGDDGVLDVVYDHERVRDGWSRADLALSREPSMWRYRPLLPVTASAPVPPLRIGWTPLYPAPRLAAGLGIRHLWVKDEGGQPTGSLKDRASAMAVVKAEEVGAATLTTASTGNAAAALAGVCASVGRRNVIFVPATAPQAKIVQLLAFGSTVLLVDGSYDEAVELCLRAAERFGWYNRTTGYNPYMSEGKKTAAFEIAEQLDWEVPDAVVVSVGDGCIIGGLHKGFLDLLALGWIERMPRLIGIQAEGSAFLAEAWERGEDVVTKSRIDAHTIADSISAGLPRDRIKAMRAVVETGGAFVRVDDDAILAAIPVLARSCGVFAEPAAAAAYAGLEVAVAGGIVDPGERVVVMSTGTGLKDVPAALRAGERSGLGPHRVVPELTDVERALAGDAGRGA